MNLRVQGGCDSRPLLYRAREGGTDIVPQNYVGYFLSAALIGADGLLNGFYATPFTDTQVDPETVPLAAISHVSL